MTKIPKLNPDTSEVKTSTTLEGYNGTIPNDIINFYNDHKDEGTPLKLFSKGKVIEDPTTKTWNQ